MHEFHTVTASNGMPGRPSNDHAKQGMVKHGLVLIGGFQSVWINGGLAWTTRPKP
jgi:hypothetical protein